MYRYLELTLTDEGDAFEVLRILKGRPDLKSLGHDGSHSRRLYFQVSSERYEELARELENNFGKVREMSETQIEEWMDLYA